jgi:branched-chain amino acid transport system ATP-binding protein
VLTLVDIHAGYGNLLTLHGIDMDVPAGDLRVVVGPNGAGKSTILKTVFGLITTRRGSVLLDGEDVTRATSRMLLQRGMAFVPQAPSIFPQLTVADNLEMGLYQDVSMRRDAVERVFGQFPLLAKRRTASARTLSGGERRLLEIARALMIGPRVLLLDEPSLGLSPVMMNGIFEEVRRINAAGVTVVLVEQRIKAALTIARSLSVVRLGRVVYNGSPDPARDPRHLADLLYGDVATARSPSSQPAVPPIQAGENHEHALR